VLACHVHRRAGTSALSQRLAALQQLAAGPSLVALPGSLTVDKQKLGRSPAPPPGT